MPWTNLGLLDKVKAALSVADTPQYVLRLYVNNIVITLDTVTEDLNECSLGLYAGVPFEPDRWDISVDAGTVTAGYPAVTFAFGPSDGSITVYGYVVTDNITGHLAWGEQFASPWPVPAFGGALTVEVIYLDQGQ